MNTSWKSWSGFSIFLFCFCWLSFRMSLQLLNSFVVILHANRSLFCYSKLMNESFRYSPGPKIALRYRWFFCCCPKFACLVKVIRLKLIVTIAHRFPTEVLLNWKKKSKKRRKNVWIDGNRRGVSKRRTLSQCLLCERACVLCFNVFTCLLCLFNETKFIFRQFKHFFQFWIFIQFKFHF